MQYLSSKALEALLLLQQSGSSFLSGEAGLSRTAEDGSSHLGLNPSATPSSQTCLPILLLFCQDVAPVIGFCPKREIRNDSESKIGDTNIKDLLKQVLIIAET